MPISPGDGRRTFPSIGRFVDSRLRRSVTAGFVLAPLMVAPLAPALVGAAGAAPLSTTSTGVAATKPRPVDVALRVLLLDDGQPMVGAIADRLTIEGVPFTKLDLASSSRPVVTAAFLATSDSRGVHAKFAGVVSPSEAPSQLSAHELSLLASYERTFKVRQVNAYTWANPSVGLNYAGYVGRVDGMTATLSAEAKTGAFGYLRDTLALDDLAPSVDESWGYLGTPAPATDTSAFTPLLTATIPGSEQQGSLIGQYVSEGREQLVITFASNAGQQHWRVLSHGIVSWLTRGVSTSMSRNYFSVHVDDVFLPDALWSVEGQCTIGDGCDPVAFPETAPGATVRMTAADVDRAAAWQTGQGGFKLDQAYNAFGITEHQAENGNADPLWDAFNRNKAQFRWINHTWSHPYLGCVQNFATVPWTCATTATGATSWPTTKTIRAEISKNVDFGYRQKLPQFDSHELVTGEHSGLKSLPQMPTDNPNLVTAVNNAGVTWIASDASRESASRKIGKAHTVPRYPMNIFYNVATKRAETSEYNWIYTSRADGGSGACTDNPAVTTCITPLDLDTGFDSYIAPLEAKIAFSHIVNDDAMPHYSHQSNIADEGILYPVLDQVLARYGSTFADNAPLVNPRMRDAGRILLDSQTWRDRQASVTATISGRDVTVRNAGTKSLTVPLTVPDGAVVLNQFTGWSGGAFGAAYGAERSAWTSLAGWATQKVRLAAESGFATEAVWPLVATGPAQAPAAGRSTSRAAQQDGASGAPSQKGAHGPKTRVVRLPEATSAVLEKHFRGKPKARKAPVVTRTAAGAPVAVFTPRGARSVG